LINTDGTLQTSCIKRFPTLTNQALEFELLKRIFPRAPMWGMALLFAGNEAVGTVDAISGACMMMSREAFDLVGQFSSTYFMYSEDVDLCYKLQASGHHNYFLGNSTVVHHGGKSTANQKSWSSAIVMCESRYQFFSQTRGAAYAAGYRFVTGVTTGVRILLLGVWWCLSLGRAQGGAAHESLLRYFRTVQWSLGLRTGKVGLGHKSSDPSQHKMLEGFDGAGSTAKKNVSADS
jgi:hypothetical protein